MARSDISKQTNKQKQKMEMLRMNSMGSSIKWWSDYILYDYETLN